MELLWQICLLLYSDLLPTCRKLPCRISFILASGYSRFLRFEYSLSMPGITQQPRRFRKINKHLWPHARSVLLTSPRCLGLENYMLVSTKTIKWFTAIESHHYWEARPSASEGALRASAVNRNKKWPSHGSELGQVPSRGVWEGFLLVRVHAACPSRGCRSGRSS